MHRTPFAPRPVALLALATGLATSGAIGQPTANHSAARATYVATLTEANVDNAALLYNRYFALLDATDLPALAREFDFNDPAARPDAKLAALLDDNSALIAGIVRASEATTCDWGIERDQGPAALLTHLGPTRAAVRVLAADARHQLAQGNHAAVVERHTAILRMADHLTQDRVLISSLVSMAVTGLAASEAEAIGTELPAEQRKQLFREFQSRAYAADPFGIREAMKGERELFLDWVADTIDPADDGRAFLEVAQTAGVAETTAATRIARMSAAEIQADIKKAGSLYDAVDAVWNDPEAQTKLAALSNLVETGAYGQAATIFAPNVTRIHDNDQQSRNTLEKAAETLAGL